MPVHHFANDSTLQDKGLSNYWGYNTIGFFAPDSKYASADQPGRAGAGVQGDGPRAARGRHRGHPRRRLQPHRRGQPPGPDASACAASTTPRTTAWSRATSRTTWTTPAPGNTLNVRHPHALQLIMDSLRYWVTEMHVDGFRFDLAAALAREFYDVDRLSSFFDLVQQDPVVSQVKLIAEPWDVGPGGYQVGNFPPQWTEWNGKYRDTVRDFWRGEPATLGEFASRTHRLGRPVRSTPGGVRSRASTSSPPTTASRCATWCPTTRSTTRPTARTTTTARATTARGTAASRVRPTTRDPRAARAAAAQLHRHAAAVSGRADARVTVTSSAAPSWATTTGTARTTRSRGSTGRPRTRA